MGHLIALAPKAAASSGATFGEIIVLVSLILVAAGIILGKKIDNVFLSIVIQLLFILGAGILIAAAYPHKLLVPLYHISGGKLGIPA